jgi:DNA repair exonuclease SbcCD nuclease subunit
MRILIVGDQHFENKNELETNLMCDRIYEILLKEQPMYVVLLGDALHTHEIIHMGPLKRAIGFFHRVSQLTSHLFILIGNHDRINNTSFLSEDSPFMACKLWPNTTVVDKVVVKDSLAFVPYVPNGRFHEALLSERINSENIKDYKVIFAHQEFKGCKMGAITSVNGDEWPSNYPLCISGHIHDYQEVQPNLVYPGTPIQLGYGVPPSKGVMMMDIPNDGSDITYSFHDLGLPKKMIVHLTPEELSKYELPENCFIKLVCKGDTKVIREIIKMDSVKEMLKSNRVRLSIQEDRSKSAPLGVSNYSSSSKAETIPFQKRLYDTVKTQDENVQKLFESIFGQI